MNSTAHTHCKAASPDEAYFVANRLAFRCAIASIVIIGLTPEALGNDEPSITYKFFTSHVSPCGFVAEEFGESPMRAVPMM